MINKMQYSLEGLKSTLRVKEEQVAELPTRRLSPRPARRKSTVPGDSARSCRGGSGRGPREAAHEKTAEYLKTQWLKTPRLLRQILTYTPRKLNKLSVRGTRRGPRPAENGERATREASLRGSLKRGGGRGRRALCAPCLGPGGCCPAAELSPGRARNVPGSPATWPHPRRANISVFLFVPAFFYLI